MGNSVTTLNASTTTLPRPNAVGTAGRYAKHEPSCSQSTLGGRSHKSSKKDNQQGTTGGPNPENSRVLFLLYLIHRTWNVVVDTVDPKSKR